MQAALVPRPVTGYLRVMKLHPRLSRALSRISRGRLGEAPPTVAVLRLSGVISAGASRLRPGHLNLADLASAIERAFSLYRVEAVALSINSPGGSPVQSSLIQRRIRDLAEEKDVPVYAFAEDVAASGGYWLACAADEIYADANSIVGSIGVISAGFGFTGLMQRVGVERRVHYRGDRKLLLDPFAPEKPEDVARLGAIHKDIHESFIDLVKRSRGARLADDRLDDIFSGDAWTGQRALELGLIDGLGDLRGVMRDKFGDKVQLRVVGESRSWLQRRLGFGGGSLLPADWPQQLLDAAEARAHWSRYGL